MNTIKNPDDFPTTEPTGFVWAMLKTHFAGHKAGRKEFAGLASWIINAALRSRFPGCDVRLACQPLLEMRVVHVRPTRGGVIYHEGAGRGIQEANDLIKEAGLA